MITMDKLALQIHVAQRADNGGLLTVAPFAALVCRSEDGTDGTLALVQVATVELVAPPLEPEGWDSEACGYSVVHRPDRVGTGSVAVLRGVVRAAAHLREVVAG